MQPLDFDSKIKIEDIKFEKTEPKTPIKPEPMDYVEEDVQEKLKKPKLKKVLSNITISNDISLHRERIS